MLNNILDLGAVEGTAVYLYSLAERHYRNIY